MYNSLDLIVHQERSATGLRRDSRERAENVADVVNKQLTPVSVTIPFFIYIPPGMLAQIPSLRSHKVYKSQLNK